MDLAMNIYAINGQTVLELPVEGPLVGSDADARDILGEAFGADAGIIVIPAERLDPAFLTLKSGLAGNFIQKLQNYHCRLFVLGDIASQVAASTSLRDFVYETNKVGNHRFLPDRQALSAALG